MATTFVQPIDMVKVRIQILAGENPGSVFKPMAVAKNIWKTDGGLKGFYRGIDSAYMRQAVYSTARIGLFYNITEYMKQRNGGSKPTFLQNCTASLIAGGLGAFIGTPADLILIRMQSDSTLPIE